MLKKLKKYLTAVIAAAITISCAGCTIGDSTANAMTIDGYEIKAGVYIYYQNAALEDAKQLAQEADANIDLEDQDALENTTIEGKKFLDWINAKTIASCREHVAVTRKFEEYKLELEESEIENIKAAAALNIEQYPEYSENGIGEESIAEILEMTYKTNDLFDAVYGEGGTENVTEDELKDYYVENNSRVKYVDLDLHDADGNDLDEAGQKEIKDMANKFLADIKKTSSEKDMLEAFNTAQEEYDEYVSDKAAEAAAESEEETETPTEAVTTAASESDTETTTTTTTTNPYANESIIPVVTTEEGTAENDVTYYPSKTFYDWVYNDSTKIGVPEIIEEEGTIYVAVKLDIKERMTEDDLWSENAVDTQRYSKYAKDMQVKIGDWAEALPIELNQSAIDRYKPFDYEKEETTQAGGVQVKY